MMQFDTPLRYAQWFAERAATFPFVEPLLPQVSARGLGQGAILKEPTGVVAAITPFNFPLYLNLVKVMPALAVGCTVVLKPSPLTPLEAIVLGDIADEVELPAGVLNVVTGDVAASERLTTHPGVDMVSFTGSDAVGKQIMGQAAQDLKKVLLELGGKSPNIVFAGSDIAKFAAGAAFAFTIHAGQGCALPTRILAERSVYDEVVEAVVAALSRIKVGDPTDAKTGMGPLIRESQRARVEGYVERGTAEGARVACGGARPAGLERGYFFEPTLFADVDSAMAIAQDEIFGPVGVAIPFDDEDDAVRIANDTRYGLAAGLWHPDPVRAFELARRIHAGTVTMNGGGGGPHLWGPFGGYKHSGIGREFGDYGLLEYTQLKTVSWSAGRP
jgi:aldehyde dehydrogenase (NAD+)